MSVVARVFEILFKYRPVVFERGELVVAAPWPWLVVLAAGVVLALPTIVSYQLLRRRTRALDRAILTALRLGALAVLVFCLLRPMLVLATVVPQENFLAILLDDSRSMRIADDGDAPRSAFIAETFGPEGSDLLNALEDRFKLRYFKFSEGAERIDGTNELTFAGRRTRLDVALDRAVRELSAVPLAGLVVLTDGADNSEGSLTESILQLRGRGVPVHTVGLGRERFDQDIEVTRVETPRAVLKGSSVAVDVMITQTGYAGETVQVHVEDAGRILTTRDVRLPRDGEVATVRVYFTVAEPGPRLLRFRVLPQPDEQVTENNEREALLVVGDRREKILYFEGEPRFEVKFVRRALADDDNVRVVVLQQTAENKFYRLDVETEDELAGGFPTTREELFQYKGLVLGSVPASFFTHDQLQMIADFVSQRGGGLLTLGGRHAFSEGGYAGTPVESALPVELEAPAGDSTGFFAEVHVTLTPFGKSHPVTQLAADVEESEARWESLPPLSMVNAVYRTKPGATTLLTAAGDGGADLVMLAAQRYGRGRSVSFPVQDSWLWQMHADIPLDDQTHETFWRQLLRWLVSGVPDPVAIEIAKDRTGVGESTTITAEVSDSSYLAVNGAHVVAYVTSPSGAESVVPMDWTVERDGEYATSFTPQELGLYGVRVRAEQGDSVASEATGYVEAAEPVDEYFDAEMRAPLLERLAEETGGRFYTRSTVATLPEDVRFTESGSTVYEEKDLWDMPIVFLVLVGLLAGEWGYRRVRGLV